MARSLKTGLALITLALAACGDAATEKPLAPAPRPSAEEAQAKNTASTPGSQRNAAMRDVTSFIPTGMTALEKLRGDLTGSGRSDALLIATPPSKAGEKLGEGQPRIVILIVQDKDGNLSPAGQNAKIVPCERCGGIAGDPYGYSRIEKGTFTISVSGGSRERWADDYRFRYDDAKQAWLLDNVVREVTDTATEHQGRLELGRKDLGSVTFTEFDPASLPQPKIPD